MARDVVRQFQAADYPLLCEWWEGHRSPHVPLAALPPDSIFALGEDGQAEAFASFYLSHGIGIAFMCWLVTKPGMGAARAKAAFAKIVGYFEFAHGAAYSTIIGFTSPAIARAARQLGFTDGASDLIEVAMKLKTD